MKDEEQYAICDKDGNWLVTSNYHNNGFVICLFTKQEAQKQIKSNYQGRNFKVKKIIKSHV